jgi:hypothetical protein
VFNEEEMGPGFLSHNGEAKMPPNVPLTGPRRRAAMRKGTLSRWLARPYLNDTTGRVSGRADC